MRIYYQNVRGLRSKTALFHKNVSTSQHDLIAVTETFLTSSVNDGEMFPSDFVVLRKDRNGDAGWGGVLLATRNTCVVRQIQDIDGLTSDMEVLFAIITWKKIKFLCGVVYLPPNYNDNQYLSVLNCIENVICQYSSLNVILFGDFNLNSCSINVKNQFECFTNFCGFHQANNILNKKGGMLDLVLSDLDENSLLVTAADALVPTDFYHPPLKVTIVWPRNPTLDKSYSTPVHKNPFNVPNWNFHKADISGLYGALVDLDWSKLYTENRLDQAVDIFYSTLNEVINAYVPLKKKHTSNKKHTYPSWYTSDIISKIKLKHFFRIQYKKNGNEFDLEMFRFYRTRVKTLIKNAYYQYNVTVESNIRNDPARFWDYVKDKRKNRAPNNQFTCNGVPVAGQEAVDAFAAYFSSVFLDDVPLLDPSLAQQHQLPWSTGVAVESVTLTEIRQAVKKLKPNNVAGPDGIPAFVVRDSISVLEDPLLHLYNLSITLSLYPSKWKVSRVTPVPKGGKSVDISMFRPIAILSIFGKIFENIITRRINTQISPWLDNAQHGFRRSRSTTTNHVNFTDYIVEALDRRLQVDAAYFDFRKAFDVVDNDILLQKCSIIGFTPKLLSLIASYLKNRAQYVHLNGYCSSLYYTMSGVSQGSTLGPILFLIMVNDLPRVVKSAKCLMFADDLKLYLIVKSNEDTAALQGDINEVAEWSNQNRLHFNTDKCKTISFTRLKSPITNSYHLLGTPLERVTEIKDLGLNLDSGLNFRQHIKSLSINAHKMLGFVMRMAYQFQDVQVALVLFNTYVRSRLEFGAIVWDPSEKKYILMVEKVQKKFARYMYKRIYGYYPFLYPSLFVTGMVGMNTLELRRKLLLLIHYFQLLRNAVDNPTTLSRLSIAVPKPRNDIGEGPVAPRRRPLFFHLPSTSTRHARNCPTRRALELLNKLLLKRPQVDLFANTLAKYSKEAELFLTLYRNDGGG